MRRSLSANHLRPTAKGLSLIYTSLQNISDHSLQCIYCLPKLLNAIACRVVRSSSVTARRVLQLRRPSCLFVKSIAGILRTHDNTSSPCLSSCRPDTTVARQSRSNREGLKLRSLEKKSLYSRQSRRFPYIIYFVLGFFDTFLGFASSDDRFLLVFFSSTTTTLCGCCSAMRMTSVSISAAGASASTTAGALSSA